MERASARVIESLGLNLEFSREINPLSAASSTARHIQSFETTSEKYFLH